MKPVADRYDHAKFEPEPELNSLTEGKGARGDLRAVYDRVVRENVGDIAPIDHGNAWSVYFNDPEANRLEVYMATPWYIAQPHAEPLDMSLSDQELRRSCEDKIRADPSFEPAEDWRAGIGKEIGVRA